MKAIIVSIFFVILGTNAYAAHPWAQFRGCYKSLERNGQPIVPPTRTEWSYIDETRRSSYTDTADKELRSMRLVSFKKSVGHLDYYDLYEAFKKIGQYSQDQDGYHYSFNGPLKYRTKTFNMSLAITLQKRPNYQLFVKVRQFDTDETGILVDVENEHLLQRVSCK